MDSLGEHYCVRWKGFHSNIVLALEDLKSDEEFVDVTLSCEGQTIQGHKVILSASSPYFRKILKDNPCRHPVLILNDIQVDVLEALMTYMYQGTVSVPHNKLQVFLKTAEALKIKGIVDCLEMESSAATDLRRPNTSSANQAATLPPPPNPVDDAAVAELLQPPAGSSANARILPDAVTPPLQHPAGDLSLLATAAASALAAAAATTQPPPTSTATGALVEYVTAGALPNPKRRKTAPRKLGSFLSSSPAHEPFSPVDEDFSGETEKENKSLLSLALTAKDINNISGLRPYSNIRSFDNIHIKPEPNLATAPPRSVAASDGSEAGKGGSVAPLKLERHGGAARNASTTPGGEEEEEEGGRAAALNLSKAAHQSLSSLYAQQDQKMSLKQELSGEKEVLAEDQSLDLSVKSSSFSSPPSSFSQSFHLLPAQLLASSQNSLTFMGGEGLSAADQLATMLGPEQMAALLGPSWKSRQPRMCQYCQRMFSNKFNLKQHVLNMHTVGREMMCEICNKKVKNKWYLRRHHVTHHGAPLKK